MKPELTDVPETMLWTLHNRASEALRRDGMLRDEEALRIYRALDYDYERSFGRPNASHAVRSATFDEGVRQFLSEVPDGVIVNLGEGLETQRFRVDNDRALWLSVDVAEAIAVRERFIAADERHRHVVGSALDETWLDAIPEGREAFVTAQGLFMYFAESDVRHVIDMIGRRLPGARLMFDSIPLWFSRKTVSPKGMQMTPHYKAPKMPWGIRERDIEPLLRGWVPDIVEVRSVPYRMPRGISSWLFPVLGRFTAVRDQLPRITFVRFGGARS